MTARVQRQSTHSGIVYNGIIRQEDSYRCRWCFAKLERDTDARVKGYYGYNDEYTRYTCWIPDEFTSLVMENLRKKGVRCRAARSEITTAKPLYGVIQTKNRSLEKILEEVDARISNLNARDKQKFYSQRG